MANTNTIWIYDEDQKCFRQVNRDRVDFSYPYNPEKRVRFNKNKKSWMFVAYGETAEEAAERQNYHTNEKIAKLEAEITSLIDQLVHP